MSQLPPEVRNSTPPVRYAGGQVAMFVLGSIMLLPGLCSLAFIIAAAGNLPRSGDPVIALWWICFAVSAGGIALIYVARRNAREAASRSGPNARPRP